MDVGWSLDERGLVEREDYSFDLEATRSRDYRYDARGLLVGVVDGAASEAFAYDADGYRTRIEDARGVRAQQREAGLVTVGDTSYHYDALGRMVERARLGGVVETFAYGPRGELDRALTATGEVAYRYDHLGHRVLKERQGRPVAAYLGAAYLDEDHLVMPVEVAGRLVGVLVDGAFEPAAADPRGSTIRLGASQGLPGAYGERASRLALAEALDYAHRGYDPDLGSVRMGVRDYDPELGEFWTPDPLIGSSITACADSPVECNLYGYARGNPIHYVDPAGTQALPPSFGSTSTRCATRWRPRCRRRASSCASA